MPKFTFIIWFLASFIMSIAQPVNADSSTMPLSQYMLNDEAMMLRHTDGEYSISIPISDRIVPQSATLNLVLTNSNVLKGNRSQVAVYVNDYVIGQIRLDPVNHYTQAKLQIEPEYLKHGYNKITFKAAQHYTDSHCEDWSAPELWTQIDASKSTFTLNYQRAPITEKLSALDQLINDRVGRYALTILRGEDMAVTDQYLYWGALISQAVKLRLQYVPLQLEEKTLTPYGDNAEHFAIPPSALTNDAILVGTKAQLAKLIPAALSEAIQGPYLGIFAQDHDKTRFILLISGLNDEQVSAAAQSFALLKGLLPDEQQSVLQPPRLPSEPTLLAPQTIVAGHSYQFAQLNYQDHLSDQHSAVLELNLPADFYATEESMVTLNLDLAYGAAMRQDSVINLELNDIFVHAIHLKESNGAYYRNYQITLPLRSFRPGPNRLEFNAELTPSEFGECTYVQRNNLIVAIYPQSTISFPDAGHVAQLPDLKLFANTGFPLVNHASAAHTVFKLLDTSSDSIAAAWQLIATLAYQQKTPILDIHITQGDISAADNVALIGKASGLDRLGDILDAAPVKLKQPHVFPYPYKERQTASEQSWLAWLGGVLFEEQPKPEPVTIDRANVTLSQTGGLGEQFLLMSYPHPAGRGVVLALLSNDTNNLNGGLNLLLSPVLWSQMQGNVFIWDAHKRFQWQQAGDTITLTDDSLRLELIMHFSAHPWQWLALVGLLLLVTAWVTHKLLIQYQRSKHRADV